MPESNPGPAEIWEGPDETWSFNEAIEWHLARIARHEARIAEWDAETERMIERHREWNERRSAPSKDKAAQSRVAVERMMLDRIAANPKAPMTVELPSGRVASRKGATVVQVTDFDALRDWSIANNERVLRWKAEPAVDAIREALSDGEAVPGVELVEKERSVSIKIEKGEQ